MFETEMGSFFNGQKMAAAVMKSDNNDDGKSTCFLLLMTLPNKAYQFRFKADFPKFFQANKCSPEEAWDVDLDSDLNFFFGGKTLSINQLTLRLPSLLKRVFRFAADIDSSRFYPFYTSLPT